MICDWCGNKYQVAYDDKNNVHKLEKYANQPLVCNSCYKKIRRDRVLKIIASQAICEKITQSYK